jgi:hypothetical protein
VRDIVGIVECVDRRGRRVQLGLGPERTVLALVSRAGAIRLCMWLYARFRGRQMRKLG